MKKCLALFLSFSLAISAILTGCGNWSENADVDEMINIEANMEDDTNTQTETNTEDDSEQNIDIDKDVEVDTINFEKLNDPEMLRYVENCVYTEVIEELDSTEYFVENVSTVYISKEYLEEVSYNSKENIYFGYTLSELEQQFQGKSYIFTLGEEGETIVQEFANADTTYDEIMKNIAIGTGVILVCVTVSVISGGVGASAVSVIFAASAKTGTAFALSSGVLSAVTAGIITGIETKDFEKALDSAVVSGSEGFKWGAMAGILTGGIKEAVALKGATLNGLTMNEAAEIQQDLKYPLDVIKKFKNMKQYKICKSAGLKAKTINGKRILMRNIDLDYVDTKGRTNLQRMKQGLSALDPSGQSYELHHIGQEADSTLAILTKAEHMQDGNNTIWHVFGKATEVHGSGNNWDLQRKDMWKAIAEFLEKAS